MEAHGGYFQFPNHTFLSYQYFTLAREALVVRGTWLYLSTHIDTFSKQNNLNFFRAYGFFQNTDGITKMLKYLRKLLKKKKKDGGTPTFVNGLLPKSTI